MANFLKKIKAHTGYTGVRQRGRAGDVRIVLLGGLHPPEARPGRKFRARPVRRTFVFLPYRNHNEKCKKIYKFPQDLPPTARPSETQSETCKPI